MLLLDGPLRGLPPADREAVLDKLLVTDRAGAHGLDGLSRIRATSRLSRATRVLQRCHAVLVGDRPVRPGGQQDPHDLLVPRAAVAEDDGLEHRRPAEVVDVVDVDAGLDDPTYVVDVTALARGDHREPAEPVPDGQVRAGGQQRLEHRDAPGDAGDQPGRVVLVVEGVRVGSEGDEDPRDVGPVVGHGQQQGSTPMVTHCLQVGARAQGQRRGVRVAAVAAASSRRLASALSTGPAASWRACQGGDLTRVPLAASVLERRDAVPPRRQPTSAPPATSTRTVSS